MNAPIVAGRRHPLRVADGKKVAAKSVAGIVAACVLAACAAHAQVAAGTELAAVDKKALLDPLPQLREQNGVRYLQGGGEEARNSMTKASSAFNLRLQFVAGPQRRLIREVRVLVQDLSGHVVLDLPDAGPMLFVDLPRGQYRVSAEHRGAVRTQAVVVGNYSGMRAVFQW